MNIIYTALYRQWRPDTFKDVVGQDTIIRTLTNQLSSGHIAHAYLFCGSRGTGKTSTAKIFARAINCMTPTEYGPCGECEVCENLSSDSNMDILEIDAASNNGVDEIRDLREKVRFPPAFGKFKVYIIDEVHMLSIGAFNALLKTLEEPPSHAVFILATTEPHKLPATILSRCQRFDFKRISQKVIVGRMRNICDSMNIMVENEGLHTIARWAEGGMRDALSLLDQIIGFSGNQITNDDILNIIGTADQSFLFETIDDILTGNLQGMLQKINQLLDEGKALNIFTRDLLQHIRNLLIVKACEHPENLLDAADSTLEQLKIQAREAGEARLIRAIEILSPLETEMRYSSQSRIILELAAVKLCRPEQEVSLEALQDRIEILENQLKNGVMPPIPPEIEDNFYPDNTTKEASTKPTASIINKDPVAAWPGILNIIKQERPSIHVALAGAKPGMGNNDVLTLLFPPASGFHIALIEQANGRKYVEELVEKTTGQQVRVKCIQEDQVNEQAANLDGNYAVNKAIEVFGKDRVEVVDE